MHTHPPPQSQEDGDDITDYDDNADDTNIGITTRVGFAGTR